MASTCDNCSCDISGEDCHIFVLTKFLTPPTADGADRDYESATWCADCWHDNEDEMREEGWTCDEDDDAVCLETYVDQRDSPNILPYKRCTDCGERKSCGAYNKDDKWLCEDCSEDSDSDSDSSSESSEDSDSDSDSDSSSESSEDSDSEASGESCALCGCDREDQQVGCCEGCCGIDSMCDECGVWDEEEGVWRCPECAEDAAKEVKDKQD